MPNRDFDAVVVGSGPNGLAAAITMQGAGLSVLLLEGKGSAGGGMRTEELTLPGFRHDVCSAIHPLAQISPFFRQLPLERYGLHWIHSPLALAHPFDSGTAAVLAHDPQQSAASVGADGPAFGELVNRLLHAWPKIEADILNPWHFPGHPVAMASFGMEALSAATRIAKRFRTTEARGLWAGLASHSMLPLSRRPSAAIALLLLIAAHRRGWPLAQGGSGSLAHALTEHFIALGGRLETNIYVDSLKKIPGCRAMLFDVSPTQLLQIAGHKFSSLYRWQLERFRHGPGSFKIDWALDGPVPFRAAACSEAATIHLGGSFEEIASGESDCWHGRHSEKPFVLFAQQSLFDATRAPEGKQVAWAYCHVPAGSTQDMTERIEQQVERFAPGFRERILARHTLNTKQLEEYNPNYFRGDIGSGALALDQLFTRPALRFSPYRSSARGIYLCSASTPPGGGVHGMCGYQAAKRALKDVFSIQI